MTYTKLLWSLVFLIFAVDVVWITFSSFELYYSPIDLLVYTCLIFSFYIPYLLYKKFRPDPKIMAALHSGCWLLCYSAPALVLSYLAYTTDLPLVTRDLADWDHYLGVYAPSVVTWFKHHSGLNIVFIASYASFLYQKPLLLLYFSLKGKLKHLQSFMMQYMIAGLLTIGVGALFPAEGTYAWYHFAPNPSQVIDLQSLYLVRQNIVDLRELTGIIEFPSFHTVFGVLSIYTFRNERYPIFISILILNILLLLSCVSHGGHFFVDVLSGIAVALFSIGIEEFIYRKFVTKALK